MHSYKYASIRVVLNHPVGVLISPKPEIHNSVCLFLNRGHFNIAVPGCQGWTEPGVLIQFKKQQLSKRATFPSFIRDIASISAINTCENTLYV